MRPDVGIIIGLIIIYTLIIVIGLYILRRTITNVRSKRVLYYWFRLE